MSVPGTIIRKPLLSAVFESRPVDSVEVREIMFRPKQKTGLHKHPCPVLSYIAEGTAFVQVEGQDPKIFQAGSAVYEPANKVILHFDNPSDTEPLRFICFYLLNGAPGLIEMLPENS
jgi:quercetin dioxygenase-like cupin family protein